MEKRYWNKRIIGRTNEVLIIFMSFWKTLREKTPCILGLAPMDGVTDAATRLLQATICKPDLLYTEFVNVEGLARGATSMLEGFYYDEKERPIIGQIYGIEIDSFYISALILCELGFDGIDINMGCPAKKVAHRGAGAGLIETPEHAQKIIYSVKQAIQDYASGKSLEEACIRPKIITAVETIQKRFPYMKGKREIRPVSVKTRIGCADDCTTSWIPNLLECGIDGLALHGRTLKQAYSGFADWEIIKKTSQIVKKYSPDTIFLGNGDVQNLYDAKEKTDKYELNGVLIGRASFGNPWIFAGHEPSEEERKKTAIQHCQLFEEIFPESAFFIMRKHLGWYLKNFDGAKELRAKLMLANSTKEVKQIMNYKV